MCPDLSPAFHQSFAKNDWRAVRNRIAFVALLLSTACQAGVVSDVKSGGNSTTPLTGGSPGGGNSGILIDNDAGITKPNTNVIGSGQCEETSFSCEMPKCSNSDVATTLHGKVFDPAGKNPLYGVLVYIPAKPDDIGSISRGLDKSCATCVQPAGKPISGAITGADGSFVIAKVPVGKKIPLVVQIGKWRRMTEIDVNNKCAENHITDKDLTRLPKHQSDGMKASLPQIAMLVGDADRLQCLFPRMGIDAREFTPPTGSGAIHMYNLPPALQKNQYQGKFDETVHGGATYPNAATMLWNRIDAMTKYDMILLACGGDAAASDPIRVTPNPISDEAKKNMLSYLRSGGRVFAEHYHWSWIKSFPAKKSSPELSVASPFGVDVADWIPYGSSSNIATTPVLVESSFPKGQDFAKWLVSVGAAETLGTMTFDPSDDSTKPSARDESATSPSARRWIYQPDDPENPAGPAANTHYLSFNVDNTGQVVDRLDTSNKNLCGRFVYTGLHVSTAASTAHAMDGKGSFPSQCVAGDLSSYEKAIQFMMFDLASCITLDTKRTSDVIIF
jgi:hypothetical protein